MHSSEGSSKEPESLPLGPQQKEVTAVLKGKVIGFLWRDVYVLPAALVTLNIISLYSLGYSTWRIWSFSVLGETWPHRL